MNAQPDSTHIRSAQPQDLPDLVRIYNHYVNTTHITFDTQPFTVDERRAWFDGFAVSGPYRLLVADVGGRPVGYASSSPFRPRQAWKVSVETTIYLDEAFARRGIGRRLYGALLEFLVLEPGIHRAYGGIALPNNASITLHEKLGFRHIGTFTEAGRKFDRFWDVSWYERDMSTPVGERSAVS